MFAPGGCLGGAFGFGDFAPFVLLPFFSFFAFFLGDRFSALGRTKEGSELPARGALRSVAESVTDWVVAPCSTGAVDPGLGAAVGVGARRASMLWVTD